MQLNNHNFLSALGCTLPHPGDNVNAKYNCPLHASAADTLRVHANSYTGNTFFECMDPTCRFYGDAVSLLSAVKRLTITEAVAQFRPGGAYAHLLTEPLLDNEAAAYTEGRTTQSRIQAYVSQCQQACRQTPNKLQLRAGLSQSNLRVLPPEIGLLVRGDEIPRPFQEFNKTKYQRTNHIVYPFTYNGEVTHIRVEDTASTLTTATITITRDDIGVYMERFDDMPRSVIATFDPHTASLLYGTYTAESSQRPPIIAIAGFPLPERFASLDILYLLSTQAQPLTLLNALQTLAVQNYVSGAVAPPQIKVWECRDAAQITAEQLRHRLCNAEGGFALDAWLLRTMDRLLSHDGTEEVYKAFYAVTLPDSVRLELIALAQHLKISKTGMEIIQTAVAESTNRLILGNGCGIYRTTTALKALDRRGNESVLCNVGIAVNHKVRTYTGTEELIVTVTPADTATVPLVVRIPEPIWGKAKELQRHVIRAFGERNQAPYIAFYDRPGYDWRDIFCKLGEKCELHKEVQRLGCDQAHDLHLPNFVIRTDQRIIAAQKQIYTLPAAATQVYSGIPGQSVISASAPYRCLLQSCDNMYVAAFTSGLMHVIHQMTQELHHAKHGHNQRPRHLFYVESEAGIWQPLFRQLSAFFSDNDFIPVIDPANPIKSLEVYEQLGTLPLIGCLPPLRGDRMQQVILNSPISLVALTDGSTAGMYGGDLRTTYILPASDKPEPTSVIDPAALVELRESFASFILEYIAHAKTADVYVTGQHPAWSTYSAICTMLGLDTQPMMQQIMKHSYYNMNAGVNSFFDSLHRIIFASFKSPIICTVYNAMPTAASFTARNQHIFVLDDYVIISHAVVNRMNKELTAQLSFDVKGLTQELKERNLLVDGPKELEVDKNRCWIMRKETWNTHIERKLLWLPKVVSADRIIPLRSIA